MLVECELILAQDGLFWHSVLSYSKGGQMLSRRGKILIVLADIGVV